MNVHFTPINPGYINTRRIRGQLVAAIRNASVRWMKMLALYTATWEHQPTFKTTGGYKGGTIWVNVNTDDPIFWYLEEGTSVRYAAMTEGFVAKTAPHQLESKEGRGGRAYNAYPYYAFPGIEPREILVEIANIDVAHWERDIQNIFANIRFTSTEESHLG